MSENSKREKFIFFYIIYLIGLGLPVLFAVFKSIGVIKCNVFNHPRNWYLLKLYTETDSGIVPDIMIGYILLIWGVIFIIALYLSALWYLKRSMGSRNEDVSYFKEYIQVEGYLLTLVGFLIAILGLVKIEGLQDDINLSSISFPIGLALVTSILGWGLGNELMNNYNKFDLLQEPLKSLKESIEALTSQITKERKNYEKASLSYVKMITKLTKEQENAIKAFAYTSTNLNENNLRLTDEYLQSIESMKKSLRKLSLELNEHIKGIVSTVKKSLVKLSSTTEESTVLVNDKFTDLTSQISISLKKINSISQDVLKFKNKYEKDVKNKLLKENHDILITLESTRTQIEELVKLLSKSISKNDDHIKQNVDVILKINTALDGILSDKINK